MSRVGLGCMRLSTDGDRDEARGLATMLRALDEGVTWFDTAHAYGHDDGELGHNERLLGRALATRPTACVRVVTKCGMRRPGGLWEPDGRAATIRAQAKASAVALGRPADVLVLHAPDPKVSLATSIRALLHAVDDGDARAIGLSNVSRGQLDALASITKDAPLAAVEVAVGAYDDTAARGGVIAWCEERGVPVLAYSPLGGPSRASRLARDSVLQAIARRHEATPGAILIAYLLARSKAIVPLVGARRPESLSSALGAERMALEVASIATLDRRFPGLSLVRRPPRPPAPNEATGEVVMIMGVAGAGKTRLAESYVARGYERLNRDTLGGTLRGVAQKLEQRLSAGGSRFVLDNTYVTRASRSEVLRVAHGHGAVVRCVHVDASTPDLQLNCALRMLDRHGELLGGAELTRRSRRDANLFAPHTLYRMERQLERPAEDEGYASTETLPFVREHAGDRPAFVIPLDLLLEGTAAGDALSRAPALRTSAKLALARRPEGSALLVYGFRPTADDAWVRAASSVVVAAALDGSSALVDVEICTHALGPPVCWCRPPLPGLWAAFSRRHGIDPRRSTLLAATPAHRAMAKALGVGDTPFVVSHAVGRSVVG